MADTPEEPSKPDPKTEIVRKVGPMLRPEKKQEGERILASIVQKHHQGPLPPPEDLAGYDHILPGAAERIVSMAERNLEHRQTQESRALGADIRLKTCGQIFALIALFAMLGVIVAAIVFQQPWVAGVLGTGTLASVVGMFLSQRPEKEEAKPPAEVKRQPRRKR